MKSTYLPFFTLTLALLTANCATNASLRKSIADLREGGFLLVRLQYEEEKIAALLNASQFEQAHNLALEQENWNQSILQAFESACEAGQVYFFYANKTEAVLQGRLKQALIFDAQKRAVDTRLLMGRPYRVFDAAEQLSQVERNEPLSWRK